MVPLVGKRCYRVVRWANYLGALGRKASGDTGLFRAADVAACEAEMKGLALHNGTLKPAASSAAPAEPKKKPQKIPQAPQAPAAPATDLHPFARIDLRVGRIVSVERHPAADRLYVEQVDLGEESGPRTVVSGLVDHVPLEALQNRLAVFICNLKPATLCKVVSSAMLLVSKDEKTGVLEPLVVPEGGKAGDRISIAGVTPQPDAAIKPKEDTWERVKADLRTVNGVAHWKDCRLLVNGLADSTGHITSTAVPNGTIS